jgi:hypothetical protein
MYVLINTYISKNEDALFLNTCLNLLTTGYGPSLADGRSVVKSETRVMTSATNPILGLDYIQMEEERYKVALFNGNIYPDWNFRVQLQLDEMDLLPHVKKP